MISAAAKAALDLRLASGEITTEEYSDLLRLMSGPAEESWALNIAPHELVLEPKSFYYKKQLFLYDQVIRLEFSAYKHTYNFLPISRSITLSFDIAGGPKVFISESGGILPIKKAHVIKHAYELIRKSTFQARCDHYWRELASKKSFNIGGVIVSIFGYVERGGIRISLADAARDGGIQWGTTQRSGIITLGGETSTVDPCACVVQTARPSQKIVFSISYDYDVIREILEVMASSDAQKG